LIHETRVFPELAYSFKHAVIQDVAYESLLVQRRQALHGAIGEAIEDLYADHLEEQAAVLAYHAQATDMFQQMGMSWDLIQAEEAQRAIL